MTLVRGLMALFVVSLVGLGGAVGCNSCREEPTIIIRFEPSDADVKPSQGVSAPSPTPTPTPEPAMDPHATKKKVRECKVYADCVVAPEDCCDCANGGKQHALPKTKLNADKTGRAARCKHAMCTMMISTDPTCGMRADCVGGACVMVKK